MVAHLGDHKFKGMGVGSRVCGIAKLASVEPPYRVVWFVDLVLLGAIGAAIGLGVYFAKGRLADQQPKVLPGDMGTRSGLLSREMDVEDAMLKTGSDGVGLEGVLGRWYFGVRHVSRTDTVDARAWVEEAVVTPAPGARFGFERRSKREEADHEAEEPCEPEEAEEPKEPEEPNEEGEEGEGEEGGRTVSMATATATHPNVKPRMEHQMRGAGRRRRRFVQF